ncbi:hypothetical protein DIPPA_32046 [Diplonema papillatum]|nr:hypothetical protein DIPPA_32046 [Diplonema papillatum]
MPSEQQQQVQQLADEAARDRLQGYMRETHVSQILVLFALHTEGFLLRDVHVIAYTHSDLSAESLRKSHLDRELGAVMKSVYSSKT